MSFFEARNGDVYPISAVEYFSPGGQTFGGKQVPPRAYMKDRGFEGGGIELHAGQIEQIVRSAQPCFAAMPGFTLLEYNSCEGDPFVDEMPIIGWRMTEYGSAEPLVVCSDYEGLKGNHGVLEPSGMVSCLGGEHFASRDAWTDQQRNWAELDAARAARARAAAKTISDVP